MLFLGFDIAYDTYVINTRDVVEVTTIVRLKTLPCSIEGLSGLLNYHGTAVPVIDINAICGHKTREDTLTTRLIIINYNSKHLLAIKAENVTETLRIDENDFKTTGVTLKDRAFLGDIAEINNRLVQRIQIEQLLNNDVREQIFNELDTLTG